jgi:holin-like protein
VPVLSKRIDYGISDSIGSVFRRRIAAASGPFFAVIKTPLILAAQLLGLWALNLAGVWLVEALQLPIPGNLVGLVALYLLLSAGVVKVSWFDPLGSWLIKHLAFFFIPITVGLMDAAGFLISHAVAITVALVASAAAGILLAGLVSQVLVDKTLRARGGT